ncbi:NAD-dependent epimerase/dehydratase family protein [Clostridium chromiireducens]|uniref:NAD-dependent epimerase/dehydratase family protein n=1 Tax=Clostridium chromiireducens TaxID=225345 RepID=UPI003AF6304F
MKIFLTGATGKIGSRFVPYLIKQGHTVRILVRNAERALLLKELGAEVVLGDLLDNENLANTISGVDAVVHLAAQFRGVSEEIAQVSNIDASIALAKAALQAGVTRFVFSSTSLVYSGISRNKPCREDDVLQPVLAYPKTKMVAEEALLKLHREMGLDLRIVRFAFVYGDHDPHIGEFSPIMSTWNPSQRLSLVHHDDVCQSLILAASTSGFDGHIYNVADDIPITVAELLRLNGLPEQVPPNGGWPSFGPCDMVLDTTRIKAELNFRSKYPSFHSAMDNGAL